MICWQSEGISITPNSLSWHSIFWYSCLRFVCLHPFSASPLLGAFWRQPFIGNAQAANQTIQQLSIQYLALDKDWINKNVVSSEYNITYSTDNDDNYGWTGYSKSGHFSVIRYPNINKPDIEKPDIQQTGY